MKLMGHRGVDMMITDAPQHDFKEPDLKKPEFDAVVKNITQAKLGV